MNYNNLTKNKSKKIHPDQSMLMLLNKKKNEKYYYYYSSESN
jgi:hypothetical protein